MGKDDLIDDYLPLHLHLEFRNSPSDDDGTHLDDESDPEDEDAPMEHAQAHDNGPWRIGTSMRRALHWELLR